MLGKIVGATLIITASLPSNAQVPPAPSLPGQDRLSEELVRSIETKNLAAYGALLSDAVHVSEDGKEVARSKTDWMNTFGKKLSADGVVFKMAPGFSSTGRLLFIEYFNSAGSWGGDVPAHCCWSYDAVAYDLAGGKVIAIRRLRGGNTKLDERGSPAK
ncbi:hypothetical protein [Sphingomonas endolithica]|uniref:hypothetical protein n=1 Tax=Sphingomonas endolithica TaxID=2972485 RepID=UPI0021AEFFEA|nr:hypothetical protein [Sphingomonas sp. ZFBP2030]